MRFLTSAIVSVYACFLKCEHLSIFLNEESAFLTTRTCNSKRKPSMHAAHHICYTNTQEHESSLLYSEDHSGGPGVYPADKEPNI